MFSFSFICLFVYLFFCITCCQLLFCFVFFVFLLNFFSKSIVCSFLFFLSIVVTLSLCHLELSSFCHIHWFDSNNNSLIISGSHFCIFFSLFRFASFLFIELWNDIHFCFVLFLFNPTIECCYGSDRRLLLFLLIVFRLFAATVLHFYLAGPGGNGLITATAACCVVSTAAEIGRKKNKEKNVLKSVVIIRHWIVGCDTQSGRLFNHAHSHNHL